MESLYALLFFFCGSPFADAAQIGANRVAGVVLGSFVQPGMTESQVRTILGVPDATDTSLKMRVCVYSRYLLSVEFTRRGAGDEGFRVNKVTVHKPGPITNEVDWDGGLISVRSTTIRRR